MILENESSHSSVARQLCQIDGVDGPRYIVRTSMSVDVDNACQRTGGLRCCISHQNSRGHRDNC
jgi:hypothetical protein